MSEVDSFAIAEMIEDWPERDFAQDLASARPQRRFFVTLVAEFPEAPVRNGRIRGRFPPPASHRFLVACRWVRPMTLTGVETIRFFRPEPGAQFLEQLAGQWHKPQLPASIARDCRNQAASHVRSAEDLPSNA